MLEPIQELERDPAQIVPQGPTLTLEHRLVPLVSLENILIWEQDHACHAKLERTLAVEEQQIVVYVQEADTLLLERHHVRFVLEGHIPLRIRVLVPAVSMVNFQAQERVRALHAAQVSILLLELHPVVYVQLVNIHLVGWLLAQNVQQENIRILGHHLA